MAKITKPIYVFLVLSCLIYLLSLDVMGNPYEYISPKLVSPPSNSFIQYEINSPKPNFTYPQGTVDINFNVTFYAPDTVSKVIGMTKYQGDWMAERGTCPYPRDKYGHRESSLQYNFSIDNIPFGSHSLNFTTHAQGTYIKGSDAGNYFVVNKTTTLFFSVNSPLVISMLTPENGSRNNSTISLVYTINHPVTQTSYCIDEQDSIPISGNITLNDISNGYHKLTLYATDQFGNEGKSETMTFYVGSEELSVGIIIIAGVVTVSIVGLSIVVYKKKEAYAHCNR
jgi:hypothetical protein